MKIPLRLQILLALLLTIAAVGLLGLTISLLPAAEWLRGASGALAGLLMCQLFGRAVEHELGQEIARTRKEQGQVPGTTSAKAPPERGVSNKQVWP